MCDFLNLICLSSFNICYLFGLMESNAVYVCECSLICVLSLDPWKMHAFVFVLNSSQTLSMFSHINFIWDEINGNLLIVQFVLYFHLCRVFCCWKSGRCFRAIISYPRHKMLNEAHIECFEIRCIKILFI